MIACATIQGLARTGSGNFAKKPVAVYFDTGVGVPLNRLYVEQLCDYFGVQLWTLRTEESFIDWLRRDGAPGPGAHPEVRNELKGRQGSKLTSLADNPWYVLGIAADESDNRAERQKIEVVRRQDNGKIEHVEVYPCHRLSRKERVEIILRSGCPLNPLWTQPKVIKDCGCFCHGDPSEVDRTKELFPAFGQRLDEWEEAINHDGLKSNLGWGGLSAPEQKAIENDQKQAKLTTCGVTGCQRARDPAEVRAIEAKTLGATIEEAVSILYEDPINQKATV